MKTLRLLSVGFLFIMGSVFAQTTQEVQLAGEYFQKSEFDKALPFYEKFHRNEPANKEFYSYYVACLQALKEDKTAEKVIKKQIREFQNDFSYRIDLGKFYYTTGDSKRGESVFKDAIENVIPLPEKVEELASGFLLIQEYDFAIATYTKGRKILGNLKTFSLRLAEIYAIKGDNQKMMDELMAVLKEDPTEFKSIQNVLVTTLDEDPESPINSLVRNTLLREVQKNPAEPAYAEMLIWLYIQQRNFESAFIQAKALDKRLQEQGERIIELAGICLDNRKYDLASKCYQYVIDKGPDSYLYINARIELLKVANLRLTEDYKLNESELIQLEQNYITTIQEIGNPRQYIPLSIQLAHLQAFYLNKPQVALDALQALINGNKGTPQEVALAKLELADILVLTGEMWEPSLLYGQVDKDFKNDLLGQDAKFRNARLSFFRCEFPWAQDQVKVLKASTSKLIANDALALSLLITDNSGLDSTYYPLAMYARADLLAYQSKLDAAQKVLDSLFTEFPGHTILDDALYKKAEIAAKQGNFEQAAQYYMDIVKTYALDVLGDDALFKLADITERKFGDTQKAMELYQELLLNYPGSLYVVEARKRFRQLRGDKLN